MIPIINRSFAPTIKDVDVKKGIVEGYFSTWGVVDAHEDEIIKGAYAKTLQENGPGSQRPRIFHLWMHDTRFPLARFTDEGSLKEDDKGLFFHSRISQTTVGRDALLLYQDGVIKEHSVGIQIIKNERAGEHHMRILEAKLWEGSTVTWGANENTPVTAVKDMDPEIQMEKFSERIQVLTKSLRDGTYTDETFILLELQLKQIEDSYQSLIDKIQPGQPTGGGEPTPKRVPVHLSIE